MLVDIDDAHDKWTRTGFMVYMNMSPINWYSKRQSTIEASVFYTEFVAMKVRIETLHAILYKLRMMGIPISGASYIHGGNMSFIHNTSRPESTLKKKCNAIAYHVIHESVAMGETSTGCKKAEGNPAYLLTKIATGGKFRYFVSLVLYDIYDEHT